MKIQFVAEYQLVKCPDCGHFAGELKMAGVISCPRCGGQWAVSPDGVTGLTLEDLIYSQGDYDPDPTGESMND